MNKILVIGATGRVGRQVVAQLADAGAAVRAMARRPETAAFPPAVEIARGDLTAPETLDACLDGVSTVFLVWTAPANAFDAAFERIARRARRIVFLSAPLKTDHPLVRQPNASRAVAERIEKRIEDSGLEWTFLRPGMFSANALRWWGPQTRADDLVRWPYLETPTAPIDERDIAAIGVRALTEDGHGGAEYVLTGPQSLTQREQVAIIGRAIGRELRIEEASPEDWRESCGFPAAIANMLLDAWAAAQGHPAFLTSTFQELTGRPPRTFFEWALDHAAAFQPAGLAQTAES